MIKVETIRNILLGITEGMTAKQKRATFSDFEAAAAEFKKQADQELWDETCGIEGKNHD